MKKRGINYNNNYNANPQRGRLPIRGRGYSRPSDRNHIPRRPSFNQSQRNSYDLRRGSHGRGVPSSSNSLPISENQRHNFYFSGNFPGGKSRRATNSGRKGGKRQKLSHSLHGSHGSTSDSPTISAESVDDLLSKLSGNGVTNLVDESEILPPPPAIRTEARQTPVTRRGTRRLRRLPQAVLEEIISKSSPEVQVWTADSASKIPEPRKVVLQYLSKGKIIERLPSLQPKFKYIKAPPDGQIALLMPKTFKIDLNTALYVPYTRHLYSKYQPSFVLEFDLESDKRSSDSAFQRLDPSYVRIAETMSPFIVGNQAFECAGISTVPEISEENQLALLKVPGGEQVVKKYEQQKRIKYRTYLVPQFILCDDVKSDFSHASGVIDSYMQDFIQLNTEWSYAPHPDAREQMKKSVTGIRFKVFTLPEKALDEWSEAWYQRTLEKKKLHLILDLDKTLIKAFQESNLDSLREMTEDSHLQEGVPIPTPPKKADGLPEELSGTDSFQIDFMFNGKKKVLWIKPRPYLKEFLTQAAKEFEISVLSMGVPQYIAKVIKGLILKYPSISEAIPPPRVFSSAYTVSKAKMGTKDLRMLYPFCRFKDRRNAVVVVDDTLEVWEGRENYRDLVFPISRYEGVETSEVVKGAKSSLQCCLEKLQALRKSFYSQSSLSVESREHGRRGVPSTRKVHVADLWMEILSRDSENSKQKKNVSAASRRRGGKPQ